MTAPLVTIGLTAFNSVATVERALRSALAQTWRPLEVIAVDDCSTDGTRELLDRLSKECRDLRVFGNPVNGGVAVSRNRILSEARGDFVAFFDDDDESLPHRVALQMQRILRYEVSFASGAPVICHTARRVVYPRGRERIESTMGQVEGCPAPAGPAVARRILLGTPLRDGYGACPTCSQMARLATYHALGGFDPGFRRSEDTDFNIRLALAGGHFVGIAEPLVLQTMTRSSEKTLADEYRYLRQILEKHRAILDEAGQYEFCHRWTDAKELWHQGRQASALRILAGLAVAHPVSTTRRIGVALRHLGLNRAYSRFHARPVSTGSGGRL